MSEVGRMETPQVGDWVRYRYLWAEEARKGLEPKMPRPCIVLQAAQLKDSKWEVLVVPLTNTPQTDGKWMQMPISILRDAGLHDEAASYLVYSEANTFQWPSGDVLPVKPGQLDEVVRGRITHGFMGGVRSAFESARAENRTRVVDREKLARENVRAWRQRRDDRARNR